MPGSGDTPAAGASKVWIAGYGGTPTGGASPIWIGGYITGGGGGGTVTTSVWSAADAAANGMTLSNGGLTVSEPGPALPNAWQILRGSISQTSGKLYVEFKTSTGLTTAFHYGLASTGVNINSYLGDSNYSVGISGPGAAVFFSSGFIAGGTFTGGAANVNDVLALAVDFTAGKAWSARNNVWDNSGDPVAGDKSGHRVYACNSWRRLFPAMAFAQSSASEYGPSSPPPPARPTPRQRGSAHGDDNE